MKVFFYSLKFFAPNFLCEAYLVKPLRSDFCTLLIDFTISHTGSSSLLLGGT